MNRFLFLTLLIIGFSAGCGPQEAPKGTSDKGVAPLRPWKLICLGGSSTIGEDIPPGQAYPAQLEERLQQQIDQAIKVVNAGIRGETIEGAGLRLSWILQQRLDAFLLALGEEVVDQQLPEKQARQLWENIFKTLRRAYPEIPIFILPLQSPNELSPWWRDAKEAYELIILRPNWPLIVGNARPTMEVWSAEDQAAVAAWLADELHHWPIQYDQ